jgi:hypothetical protein
MVVRAAGPQQDHGLRGSILFVGELGTEFAAAPGAW